VFAQCYGDRCGLWASHGGPWWRRWPRGVVGFDWYAFVLTDPQTMVGGALADVPAALLPQLPRLVRLKYLTPLNRWTTIGPSGVALLRRASGDDPSPSLVWSRLLAAHGVGDVASLVLRDRFGCWGFLELWRWGPAARFHADAEDLLADLAEPVTAALRPSQASTFHGHARGGRHLPVRWCCCSPTTWTCSPRRRPPTRRCAP
jgi:hypothetical protein